MGSTPHSVSISISQREISDGSPSMLTPQASCSSSIANRRAQRLRRPSDFFLHHRGSHETLGQWRMNVSSFLQSLATESGPDKLKGAVVLVALDRPIDHLIQQAGCSRPTGFGVFATMPRPMASLPLAERPPSSKVPLSRTDSRTLPRQTHRTGFIGALPSRCGNGAEYGLPEEACR